MTGRFHLLLAVLLLGALFAGSYAVAPTAAPPAKSAAPAAAIAPASSGGALLPADQAGGGACFADSGGLAEAGLDGAARTERHCVHCKTHADCPNICPFVREFCDGRCCRC